MHLQTSRKPAAAIQIVNLVVEKRIVTNILRDSFSLSYFRFSNFCILVAEWTGNIFALNRRSYYGTVRKDFPISANGNKEHLPSVTQGESSFYLLVPQMDFWITVGGFTVPQIIVFRIDLKLVFLKKNEKDKLSKRHCVVSKLSETLHFDGVWNRVVCPFLWLYS